MIYTELDARYVVPPSKSFKDCYFYLKGKILVKTRR